MPNNHGYLNSTMLSAWDVDAYVCAGVATVDLDNGTLVTRGTLNVDSSKNLQGYEFNVAKPGANATNLWIVDTPTASGASVEMQILNDPRNFYNIAGRPVSLRYLVPEVDFIEVDANCFATGSAPSDQPTYTFVSVNTDGKLVIAQSAPASGTYFSLEAINTTPFGQELAPTYILKCVRN